MTKSNSTTKTNVKGHIKFISKFAKIGEIIVLILMYFGVVIEILLTKSNVTSTTMLENEQRKNSTTKTARLKQHGNGWAKFSQIDISKESLLGPLKYEGSLILMT